MNIFLEFRPKIRHPQPFVELPMCTTGRKDEQFSPTFQVIVGPPAQLARLAGELVLNVLIVLAGGADPAAAHLALPDHLHATQPGRQRW